MGTIALEEAFIEEKENEDEAAFKDDAERLVWDKAILERLMDTLIEDYV